MRVKAKIRCEIEVEVGVWDGKASFDSLKEQVRGEGARKVSNLISEHGGKVIGTPKVIMVQFEERDT